MSNKTRASNNIIVIFKRGQIPQKNLEIKLKYHFKKGQIPQKGTDSAVNLRSCIPTLNPRFHYKVFRVNIKRGQIPQI